MDWNKIKAWMIDAGKKTMKWVSDHEDDLIVLSYAGVGFGAGVRAGITMQKQNGWTPVKGSKLVVPIENEEQAKGVIAASNLLIENNYKICKKGR